MKKFSVLMFLAVLLFGFGMSAYAEDRSTPTLPIPDPLGPDRRGPIDPMPPPVPPDSFQ